MLQEKVLTGPHGLEHADRRRLPSDIKDSVLPESYDRHVAEDDGWPWWQWKQ